MVWGWLFILVLSAGLTYETFRRRSADKDRKRALNEWQRCQLAARKRQW